MKKFTFRALALLTIVMVLFGTLFISSFAVVTIQGSNVSDYRLDIGSYSDWRIGRDPGVPEAPQYYQENENRWRWRILSTVPVGEYVWANLYLDRPILSGSVIEFYVNPNSGVTTRIAAYDALGNSVGVIPDTLYPANVDTLVRLQLTGDATRIRIRSARNTTAGTLYFSCPRWIRVTNDFSAGGNNTVITTPKPSYAKVAATTAPLERDVTDILEHSASNWQGTTGFSIVAYHTYTLLPTDIASDLVVRFVQGGVSNGTTRAELTLGVMTSNSSGLQRFDPIEWSPEYSNGAGSVTREHTFPLSLIKGQRNLAIRYSVIRTASASTLVRGLNRLTYMTAADIRQNQALSAEKRNAANVVFQNNLNADRQIANDNKNHDDVMNAGKRPPVDTSDSNRDEVISNLRDWSSQIRTFSDTISNSGTEAKQSIQQGFSVFEAFISSAPTIVMVLIAFAVLFLVVRKILGR